MIAKLTGKLDSRYDTSIIIDVNGVGYALSCSRHTVQNLPLEGEQCTLFVEPLIRSENITLFGFLTEAERSIFRLLLTIQGVGGKVCMSLLSSLTPVQIHNSILSQDHTPLMQADGVGAKVAQRIVRELKDKTSFVVGKGWSSESSSDLPSSSLQQEAVSALINLGYKKQEAVAAVYHVIKQDGSSLSLNQIIPLALKQLARA